jgi:hypothetical protein
VCGGHTDAEECAQKKILSAGSRSASAILTALPVWPFTLTDEALCMWIRARCGIRTLQEDLRVLGPMERCPLCHGRLDEEHDQACRRTTGIRRERHDDLCNVVERAIRDVPGAVAVPEPHHGDELALGPDGEERLIPDLRASVPDAAGRPQTIYVDAVFTDPLCSSHAVRALRGEAPDQSEERKVALYANWLRANPGRLFPVGLSSHGQLGPSARALLHFLREAAVPAARRGPDDRSRRDNDAARRRAAVKTRWWTTAMACVAVRYAPRVRQSSLRQVAHTAVARLALLRGAPALQAQAAWDEDVIEGDGLAPATAPQ